MASELAIPPGISFYLDWKFWSFAVSFLALLISLLPHTKRLKRARLDCDVYQKIHISHKVGNPNAQAHIILTNVGGREVRVKGMALKFQRNGAELFPLPAGNYLGSAGIQAMSSLLLSS